MTAADADPERPRVPLLAVEALAFAYDGEGLLSGLGFSVHPGEALLVVGGNGSGKSTLLRLLAGLLAPDGGRVQRAADLDGEPVALAWLGHGLALKPALTVAECLRFAIGVQGADGRVGLPQALASVGLDGFSAVPVRELSAGQRKRVALARLLLVAAPLWLLDEPYANLDPDGCRLVDRLLDRHLRSGGGAVLCLHRADQAAFTGPRRLLDLGAAP